MPLSQPIKDYKQPWESIENWELRQEFLERYEDAFEENRLLCLAQAYVNVTLLGCKYPEEVMQQINELAEGLVKGEEIREQLKEKEKQKKANKKQRTEQLGSSIGRPRPNNKAVHYY